MCILGRQQTKVSKWFKENKGQETAVVPAAGDMNVCPHSGAALSLALKCNKEYVE